MMTSSGQGIASPGRLTSFVFMDLSTVPGPVMIGDVYDVTNIVGFKHEQYSLMLKLVPMTTTSRIDQNTTAL